MKKGVPHFESAAHLFNINGLVSFGLYLVSDLEIHFECNDLRFCRICIDIKL